MSKQYHNKEWLIHQHHELERSVRDIARECGVTHSSVLKFMRKHDIRRLPRGHTLRGPKGPLPESVRKKISEANKGRKFSEEQRRNMALAKMGEKNPMCGKSHTEEAKRCIGAAHRGARNPNWRGGQRVSRGYVYVKCEGHPHADQNGYVKRARLVKEKELGRYLDTEEIAHHVDGDKQNDVPENIRVVSRAEHINIHREDLLNSQDHRVRE